MIWNRVSKNSLKLEIKESHRHPFQRKLNVVTISFSFFSTWEIFFEAEAIVNLTNSTFHSEF